MTELSFSKQLLTALDTRPIKLSSDHITDPRQYPAQSAYILPRFPQSHPKPPKRSALSNNPSSASGSQATSGLTVTLKPLRGQTVTLSSQPPQTSVFELKSLYAAQCGGIPVEKIKVLLARKPCADSKTVGELIGDKDVQTLELSVMVMGGTVPVAGTSPSPAVTPAAPPKAAATPAVGEPMDVDPASSSAPISEQQEAPKEISAADALRTDDFWDDLKGFLIQRLKDEHEGSRLVGMFKEAWEKAS